MKKYIKPFFLVLFNNVFLLMINTPEVYNHLWNQYSKSGCPTITVISKMIMKAIYSRVTTKLSLILFMNWIIIVGIVNGKIKI